MIAAHVECRVQLALVEIGYMVATKANHPRGWDAKPRALANDLCSRQPGCRLYIGGSDGKAIDFGFLW